MSKPELTYYSGVGLRTDDCKSNGEAEVGFVGRVLLNAFNAWEYGWESNRAELKENSLKIFDSYLKNGFTEAGFFKEFVNLDRNFEEPVHSIRRQSEGSLCNASFPGIRERTRTSPSGVGTTDEEDA